MDTIPYLSNLRTPIFWRRPSLVCGVFLVYAAMTCQPVYADLSDRDQPLSFSADSIRVEEKNKRNLMEGNVEISKGSIVVRADRVEVLQGADGSQKATAFGGKRGQAIFRQRREGRNEMIEGEADKVSYDSRSDMVNFSGRAVLRRLIGATVVDEVSGQTIVYDNKTDVFQVSGGTTPSASKGRVRGVITPRKTGSSLAPAPSVSALGFSGASLLQSASAIINCSTC